MGEDCKSMQGDLTRIEKWGEIFKDPKKLMTTLTENVLKNWSKIQADITKIPTDFTKSNYKGAGQDIADIMVQALGPVPESSWGDVKRNMKREHFSEFAHGPRHGGPHGGPHHEEGDRPLHGQRHHEEGERPLHGQRHHEEGERPHHGQ